MDSDAQSSVGSEVFAPGILVDGGLRPSEQRRRNSHPPSRSHQQLASNSLEARNTQSSDLQLHKQSSQDSSISPREDVEASVDSSVPTPASQMKQARSDVVDSELEELLATDRESRSHAPRERQNQESSSSPDIEPIFVPPATQSPTASPVVRPASPEVTIVEKSLPLTREETFTGATKKRRVKRKTYDRQTKVTGTQEKILEVPNKKGVKAGSKIKYSDMGNQTEGQTQDLHFLISEAS